MSRPMSDLERERRERPYRSVMPGADAACERQVQAWRTAERARHRHNTRMAWAVFGSLSLAGMGLIGSVSPDPGWQGFGQACFVVLAAAWGVALLVDKARGRRP